MNYAIIAAGEGSRLAQEGVAQPKPLVELNGEKMIDRLIRIFLANQATSISVIVNDRMADVVAYLQNKHLPVPFHLIVRSTPSSMHSFYELSHCLPHGKFCLTTVDTIFREEEFARYIRAFEKDTDHDGLFAVTDYIEDESPLYVDTDDQMNIRNFIDTVYSGARFISGGIYCLKSNALPVLEDAIRANRSRMRNYQRELVIQGFRLQAFPFQKIIDVDHASDIQVAESFLKA
ncbi:MAG: NTP transferase domain-containing protein [Bacteroidales bacterium]